MENTLESPLINASELIEQAAEKCGGQIGLARALGVSPQAINKWKSSRVPAERVIDFERVTGISRNCVRPDIYPS
jgi:DNA-binding transcriptional regulator YdaS (Cro superfamily)